MRIVTRPGENDLIARYFAPLAAAGALGLRDDAALLSPKPGHDLVVTVDALVEGIHFLPGDPPGTIARKALGVNVSDLAAKGADPTGFVLALALPADWTEEWLAGFSAGLGAAARDFRCPLLGGDTVRASGGLTLSITALGQVPSGTMVQRTTAKVGDTVFVTGSIGDAALGLMLRSEPAWAGALAEGRRSFLADRYLNPQPRISLAETLRRHASAAMDVSDGLAGDLAKMTAASGVSAVIDGGSVPLSEAVRAAIDQVPELFDRAVTGGDDYEILCTVPKDRVDLFRRHGQKAGVTLSPIGRIVEGRAPPVFRIGDRERCYEAGSYSHF
jgi:thiamine-monophosphate kinase